MAKLRSFQESLAEDLKDPDYAKTYLSVALVQYGEDHDVLALM